MRAHTSGDKPFKGMGMEGVVARWYAALTGKSLDRFQALAQRISPQLRPGSRVLEIAPGPGYLAIELAKLGDFHITGLDISDTFVSIARANAAQAAVQVDFQHGNASDMPFADESFDFLVCTAAFKNFTQPARALDEMYRVLKPGGHALIIDLRKDASLQSIQQAIDEMCVSRWNAAITRLTFRYMLLKRAYTRPAFEQLLANSKFRRTQIHEDRIVLEISLTKDDPAEGPSVLLGA